MVWKHCSCGRDEKGLSPGNAVQVNGGGEWTDRACLLWRGEARRSKAYMDGDDEGW